MDLCSFFHFVKCFLALKMGFALNIVFTVIVFYVTVVTILMTLLMNKFTCLSLLINNKFIRKSIIEVPKHSSKQEWDPGTPLPIYSWLQVKNKYL